MAERDSSHHESSIDRLHDCQSCVRGFECGTELTKHLLEHAQYCRKKVQIGQRKVDGITVVSLDYMLTDFEGETMFETGEVFEDKELLEETETFIDNNAGPVVNNLILPKEIKQLKITNSQSDYRMSECKFCRLLFSNEMGLVEHMKKHPVYAPYKCSVCGRDFPSRVDLSKHVLMHNQTAKYKCQKCGKGFIKIGQLAVHQKVHNRLWTRVCNVCEKGFRNNYYLLQHYVVHTGEKPFKCDECDEAFKTSQSLLHHSYKHSGNWPHVCDVCGKVFAKAAHKLSHMNVHKENKVFTCRICNAKFNNHSTVMKHSRLHTGTEGKNYKCSLCDRAYFTSSALKGHMQSHTGQYSFRCDHCDKGFSARSDLQKHIYCNHLKVKIKHVCKVCNKHYSGPKKLRIHMRSHEQDHLKCYHCHLCDARYCSKPTLIHHMQLKHLEELLEKTKSVIKDNVEEPVTSHQGSVTLTAAEITEIIVSCYQCSSCNKVFLDKISCEVHVESHDSKDIKCNHCDKNFATEIEMSTHMNVCHPEVKIVDTVLQSCDEKDEQPLGNKSGEQKVGAARVLLLGPCTYDTKQPKQCNVCGRVFLKNFHRIVAHLKRHAEKGWPLKCTQCELEFVNEMRLKRHMTIHTGEKPHKCDLCDMAFRVKPDLFNHMLKHTGRKPYQCDKCGKTFRMKAYLKCHLATHSRRGSNIQSLKRRKPTPGTEQIEYIEFAAQTTPSGEVFYPCKVCLDAFTNKASFTKHMKTHSSEEQALATSQEEAQSM